LWSASAWRCREEFSSEFAWEFLKDKGRKEKMKTLKKSVVCLFLLALALAVLPGCRTAHGFGEDLENAGQSIQNSVQ
jgi:predicted small secreted protein